MLLKVVIGYLLNIPCHHDTLWLMGNVLLQLKLLIWTTACFRANCVLMTHLDTYNYQLQYNALHLWSEREQELIEPRSGEGACNF